MQSDASKYIDYVFAPLHDTHCYAGLHCDVPRTTALVQHPAVAACHLTGSLNTHEAIVWGPPVRPVFSSECTVPAR